MSRYFLYLAYNGTNYCGWQRQPNGISIQQRIEEALFTLLRTPCPIVGAGRTDAGVHARMMVAHFDAEQLPERFTDRLDRMLPPDIAIHRVVPVKPDAHARFDALSRMYHYCVTARKDPFDHAWTTRMPLARIDFERMNQACSVLYEYSDFTSFSKLHTDTKTNRCRIDSARWTPHEGRWTFEIRADRFLRNMVRAIVGTLLEVGMGKLTIDGFRQVIEAQDRCRAGMSVPAGGLALVDIEYPASLFRLDS